MADYGKSSPFRITRTVAARFCIFMTRKMAVGGCIFQRWKNAF